MAASLLRIFAVLGIIQVFFIRAETKKCNLNFLFIAGKAFQNELIWADFFQGAESHLRYDIYVLSTHKWQYVPPTYISSRVAEIQQPYFPTNCTQAWRYSAIFELLSYSIAATTDFLKEATQVYILLPGDSVPLKSFNQTLDYYCPKVDSQQSYGNFSSVCMVNDQHDTENHDISPWMVLSRASAIQVRDQIDRLRNITTSGVIGSLCGTSPTAVAAASASSSAVCSVESGFRAASGQDRCHLFSVPSPRRTGTGTGTGTGNHKSLSASNTSSAVAMCEDTFISAPIGRIGFVNGSESARSLKIQLLEDLHRSPSLFFARGLPARESGHYINGTSRGIGHKLTLQEALRALRVYSNASLPVTSKHSHAHAHAHGKNHSHGHGHGQGHAHGHGHAQDQDHSPGTTSGEVNQAGASAGAGAEEHTRRGGDKAGLRVLMLSADDRELKSEIDENDYNTMSSVLVENFAATHGYDFLKLCSNSTLLVRKIKAKYGQQVIDFYKSRGMDIGFPDTEEHKYGVSAFHPGLLHMRASSWAKMPHVWYALIEYGQHYDYLWFLDSDAAINPLANYSRSLSDSLDKWSSEDSAVYWGNKNVREAQFIFMSNFPWRDDLPCAGTFLLKTKKSPSATNSSEEMLRQWWDYELFSKSQKDFMEQDALWYMLECEGAGDGNKGKVAYDFLFNRNHVSLLREAQFPSVWHGLNNLWVAHIPNYVPDRLVYFKYMLRQLGLLEREAFAAAVREIKRRSFRVIDFLDVVERMEQRHWFPPVIKEVEETVMDATSGQNVTRKVEKVISTRRTLYPPEHGAPGSRPDDNWHGIRNGNRRPPAPSTAALYQGMAIAITGTSFIYLVDNGTKRAFPDMQTMSKMNYSVELVLHFGKRSAEANIPDGPRLPAL